MCESNLGGNVILGVMEKLKNDILLKCSLINDDIVQDELSQLIDINIYRFSEEIINIIGPVNTNVTEDLIRKNAEFLIKQEILKKIKRKLFIDSLALQITNEEYIENFINNKITIEQISDKYIREFNKNKDSNQLNINEDTDLSEPFTKLKEFVEEKIIPIIKEDELLVTKTNALIKKNKKTIEEEINKILKQTDMKYLDYLISCLKEYEKGEEKMNEEKFMKEEIVFEPLSSKLKNDFSVGSSAETPSADDTNNTKLKEKYNKYDDMTIFNKVVLSLNTKLEQITRKEQSQEKRKELIKNKLEEAKKHIDELVINETQLETFSKHLEIKEATLKNQTAEAEVIIMNMMPLIKGLNSINVNASLLDNEVRGESNE